MNYFSFCKMTSINSSIITNNSMTFVDNMDADDENNVTTVSDANSNSVNQPGENYLNKKEHYGICDNMTVNMKLGTIGPITDLENVDDVCVNSYLQNIYGIATCISLKTGIVQWIYLKVLLLH